MHTSGALRAKESVSRGVPTVGTRHQALVKCEGRVGAAPRLRAAPAAAPAALRRLLPRLLLLPRLPRADAAAAAAADGLRWPPAAFLSIDRSMLLTSCF